MRDNSKTVLLLSVLAFAISSIQAEDHSSRILLEAARDDFTKSKSHFIRVDRVEVLATRLSILTYDSNPKEAFANSKDIKDPFYRSLALGGIAAKEIKSSLTSSVDHYQEALNCSLTTKQWTGQHAGSLGFLFGLLPTYPTEQSLRLLAASKDAFDSWPVSEFQKQRSLLELAKATTLVDPSQCQSLLCDVAIKSNHYSDSIEYLARFLAIKAPEETLRQARQRYTNGKNWPNGQYLLGAVLLEQSRTDFVSAFQGVKDMKHSPLDSEIAAVKLAESLLEQNRRKEAKEVADYLTSLKSNFEWTKTSLEKIRKKIDEPAQPADHAELATQVDAFVSAPTAEKLETLCRAEKIRFKNRGQISAFIEKALPVTDSVRDMGYPKHGSPRSDALGILVICSELIGKSDQALEISRRIEIPELRISYMLDAFESVNPLPAPVSQWPISFSHHPAIAVDS